MVRTSPVSGGFISLTSLLNIRAEKKCGNNHRRDGQRNAEDRVGSKLEGVVAHVDPLCLGSGVLCQKKEYTRESGKIHRLLNSGGPLNYHGEDQDLEKSKTSSREMRLV